MMIVNLWLYLEEFVLSSNKKKSLIAYNSQSIQDNLITGVSYNWEFHSLWSVFVHISTNLNVRNFFNN
jgi:hypothetical protein